MSRHLRAHDYGHLIQRWRKVARASGLRMRPFSESGGFTLFFLETVNRPASAPSLYISAGIHGDEAAGTESLVTWAEENPHLLRSLRALVFPCLNPWGLANNSRRDARGRDLNRCYGKRKAPQVRDQIRTIGKTRFDFAMMLHEDYDARGTYIYEVAAQKPYWAERLLAAASSHTPIETRRSIEGRAAQKGVVRRKISPDMMPDWPEAFLIHFSHARRTFTIETPSELHIDCRVAAQAAVISEAVNLSMAST